MSRAYIARPGNRAHSEGGPVTHAPPARAQRTSPLAKGEPDSTSAASGRGLDPNVRDTMSHRFGFDLSSVRVHTDERAAAVAESLQARALTRGRDIYFGHGRFAPSTGAGKRLLSHELAHVIQQSADSTGSEASNELEARISAGAVAGGGLAHVRGAAPYGVVQASALSDSVDQEMAAHGAGGVFNVLRARGIDGPIPADNDLSASLDTHFGPSSGTQNASRWLADHIIVFGSEPHWPLASLELRERLANAPTGGWAPEPGGIEGDFAVGKGRKIKAFYFSGTTAKRAMIIGGVHGTEVAGVKVVEMLLDLLRAQPTPPLYNLIVVPALFPRNVAKKRRKTTPTAVDPNRQMPKVGDAPGAADSEGRPIEAENLILLDLIERFQPERIASVHGNAHSKMGSITSDPRPGSEPADNKLALDMAKAAAKGGARVPGNKLGEPGETATYPTATAPGGHEKGVTFGEYGSHQTKTRPAMNVILIETQFNQTVKATKGKKAKAARQIELESLAIVLRDVFLKP